MPKTISTSLSPAELGTQLSIWRSENPVAVVPAHLSSLDSLCMDPLDQPHWSFYDLLNIPCISLSSAPLRRLHPVAEHGISFSSPPEATEVLSLLISLLSYHLPDMGVA